MRINLFVLAFLALAASSLFAQTLESEAVIGSGSANSSNLLKIYFQDKDGTPFANQEIAFNFHNSISRILTSAEGSVVFISDTPEQINFSITRDGYTYLGGYYANGTMVEVFKLYPLLRIGNFEKIPAGPNCYVLFADVIDPRSDTRTEVILTAQGKTENGQVSISIGENGSMVSDKICVRSETALRLIASNEYDTVNASIVLPFDVEKGVPVGGSYPTEPPQKGEIGGIEDLGLSLIALGLVVGLIGIFIFVRSNLRMVGRFIIEYVRLLMRVMGRRKPPRMGS